MPQRQQLPIQRPWRWPLNPTVRQWPEMHLGKRTLPSSARRSNRFCRVSRCPRSPRRTARDLRVSKPPRRTRPPAGRSTRLSLASTCQGLSRRTALPWLPTPPLRRTRLTPGTRSTMPWPVSGCRRCPRRLASETGRTGRRDRGPHPQADVRNGRIPGKNWTRLSWRSPRSTGTASQCRTRPSTSISNSRGVSRNRTRFPGPSTASPGSIPK